MCSPGPVRRVAAFFAVASAGLCLVCPAVRLLGFLCGRCGKGGVGGGITGKDKEGKGGREGGREGRRDLDWESTSLGAVCVHHRHVCLLLSYALIVFVNSSTCILSLLHFSSPSFLHQWNRCLVWR